MDSVANPDLPERRKILSILVIDGEKFYLLTGVSISSIAGHTP